jgi:hypothetical protein
MHTLRTRIVPLLVLVAIWTTGCANTTRAAGDAPIHFHLVCLEGADGQTVECDSAQRLAHFTAWVTEALSRPHSTFTIWAVGPTRHRSHLFFAACVPPHWGPSSWKAKAAFMAGVRAGVSGSQAGLAVPESCRPPGPQASGSHHLEVSPSASPLQRDVWQHVASGSAAAPLHLAVVCDRSDSTAGAACNPPALLRAFDRWVLKGLALPGASLSVEMVGSSRHFLRAVSHLTVPDLSVGERVAFVLGGRRELAELLIDSKEQYTSTIAEAISATVSRLRERRGRYELVVLSDLLQITSGTWNFGHALPPPDDFIAWLKKARVAADLRDIPVLACGVHTGQSLGGNGPYTAAYATRLRELWERAWQAMGAPEVQLFSACDAGFAA